jgi:hypothetical protein
VVEDRGVEDSAEAVRVVAARRVEVVSGPNLSHPRVS